MPYVKTGIKVKCPKCGREGEVRVRVQHKDVKGKTYIITSFIIYHEFTKHCSISREELLKLGININNLLKLCQLEFFK